tara:strand:- start:250 stop:750 length:501 start_codon:yes stop_codon:yes gene_type:complete
MSIKNTNWASIEPGQIITFVYKSKNESRGYKRTVLVVNPELRFRKKSGQTTKFLAGIQLLNQNDPTSKLRPSEMRGIFSRLGIENDEGVIEAGINKETRLTEAQTKNILKKIKPYMDNYRTFILRECRRRRVFLETQYAQIPKTVIKIVEAQVDIKNVLKEMNIED